MDTVKTWYVQELETFCISEMTLILDPEDEYETYKVVGWKNIIGQAVCMPAVAAAYVDKNILGFYGSLENALNSAFRILTGRQADLEKQLEQINVQIKALEKAGE
jgi:Na+/phosphate symporter